MDTSSIFISEPLRKKYQLAINGLLLPAFRTIVQVKPLSPLGIPETVEQFQNHADMIDEIVKMYVGQNISITSGFLRNQFDATQLVLTFNHKKYLWFELYITAQNIDIECWPIFLLFQNGRCFTNPVASIEAAVRGYIPLPLLGVMQQIVDNWRTHCTTTAAKKAAATRCIKLLGTMHENMVEIMVERREPHGLSLHST